MTSLSSQASERNQPPFPPRVGGVFGHAQMMDLLQRAHSLRDIRPDGERLPPTASGLFSSFPPPHRGRRHSDGLFIDADDPDEACGGVPPPSLSSPYVDADGTPRFSPEQSRRLLSKASLPLPSPPAVAGGGGFVPFLVSLGPLIEATDASRRRLFDLLGGAGAAPSPAAPSPSLSPSPPKAAAPSAFGRRFSVGTYDFEPTSIGDMVADAIGGGGRGSETEDFASLSAAAAAAALDPPGSSAQRPSAPSPPGEGRVRRGSLGPARPIRRGSVGGGTAAQRRRGSMGGAKEVTVVKAGRTAEKATVGGSTGGGGGGADAPKKRTWKKPKDKPCRPLSAYNLFFKSERKKLVREASADVAAESADPEPMDEDDGAAADAPHPPRRRRPHRKTGAGIGFARMAQTVAARWRELDPTRRAEFEAEADVERERYQVELEGWKKAQREKRRLAAAEAEGARADMTLSAAAAVLSSSGGDAADGLTGRADSDWAGEVAVRRVRGGGAPEANLLVPAPDPAAPVPIATPAEEPRRGAGPAPDLPPGAPDDFWSRRRHYLLADPGGEESLMDTLAVPSSDAFSPEPGSGDGGGSPLGGSGLSLDLGDSGADLSLLEVLKVLM